MALRVENLAAPLPFAVVAASLALLHWIVSVLIAKPNLPAELPWAGGKLTGPFAEIRAGWKGLQRPLEYLREGYKEYLSKGQSYIFPSMTGGSNIVIPNAQLRWLLDFPDHVASTSEAHYDSLAGDYAFTHPHLLERPFHEDVVHRNVPRKVHLQIPTTWDEIQYQVPLLLGTDDGESRELNLQETLTRIIAALSNRMFVGLPLCRSLKFQDLNTRFAMGVMFVVMVSNMVPRFLKSIAGILASIPNHITCWQAKKMMLPLVKQRLAEVETEESGPDSRSKTPEDYFTWHIRLAKERNLAHELEPDFIARRVMPLEFAAIHTTQFTITMTMLDLLSSDPKQGFLEALREEAERIYKECDGVWTKQALAKMVRTDSAIRESMRVSCFALRGVHRKVVAREGIKGDGWTAPYGSTIAADVWARHHDSSIYPDAMTYDALRFSRAREEASPEQYVKMQNLSVISTSEDFLPFGHGRHACPGRFFVNVELKLLLAYMVMNYEFQHMEKRPENRMVGEMILPPAKAMFRFRRRKESVLSGMNVST